MHSHSKTRLAAGKEEPSPHRRTVSLPVGEGGAARGQAELRREEDKGNSSTAGNLGPAMGTAVTLIVPRGWGEAGHTHEWDLGIGSAPVRQTWGIHKP